MLPVNGDLHKLSVQGTMPVGNGIMSIVLGSAIAGDLLGEWGTSPYKRDIELRKFWKREPWLASAIPSMCSRNAAFSWQVVGPARTAKLATSILQGANFGRGWADLMLAVSQDLYTQDAGAFIEIIRAGKTAADPVVGLASLDAAMCKRTNDPNYPVIYTDIWGKMHQLRPWQVVALSDMPSSDQRLNGYGFCAVSRVTLAAQIIRDFEKYKGEKASGRFNRAILFVSGISSQRLETILQAHEEKEDNRGLTRLASIPIIGNPSTENKLEAQLIDFASLPDHYDEETNRKWYIALLALALGADFQDLAPLPGGNLGTSTQSEVLDQKSKGKGPALFQKLIAHALNWQGIIPSSCEFQWDENDPLEDAQQASNRKLRFEGLDIGVRSGVLTVEVARMKALEDGDLTQEQFDLMAAEAEEPEPAPIEDETFDEESPDNDTGSPGADDEVVTEEEKAVSPVATKRDLAHAVSYFDRIFPEAAGILDAKSDDA